MDTISDPGLEALLQALYYPTEAQKIASNILMSASPALDDQELAQDLRLRYLIWEAMHKMDRELCADVQRELGLVSR